MLAAVVRRLDERHSAAELALRLPSLDEVFLTLTGHAATDETDEQDRKGGMTTQLMTTSTREIRHRPGGHPLARCGPHSLSLGRLGRRLAHLMQIRHTPENLLDVTSAGSVPGAVPVPVRRRGQRNGTPTSRAGAGTGRQDACSPPWARHP